MSAQGPQYHGTKKKSGEEGRFRENTAAQTPLPTRGTMFTRPLPGGRTLEPRRTPVNVASHPFKVRSAAGDDGELKFRVEPGTFQGVYPQLNGQPLNESPEAVLGPGTKWVYVKVVYSLSEANGFVYAATFTSAEIEVSASSEDTPLGPNNTGEYYILLATFNDGVKTGQPTITSLSGEVCGVADGGGTAQLLVHTA